MRGLRQLSSSGYRHHPVLHVSDFHDYRKNPR
uniref:Uncharacterized protein n=1 Tax=Anguilla anguilla TaxID=7936 RepID=A0A0E9TK24_ANGAN